MGFGWAIAKSLADAGAFIGIAVWPPALGVSEIMLERGKFDGSRTLRDGSLLTVEGVFALDAAYDTWSDVPQSVAEHKRYRDWGDFSIAGLTQLIVDSFGEGGLGILVHSFANSPEISKPLLDTSRGAYTAAVGVSAYSLVSFVHHLGPLMGEQGSVLSLSFLASLRTFPGYGGGM